MKKKALAIMAAAAMTLQASNIAVRVVINDNQAFTATIDDSETDQALVAMLPLTLTMNELNGNEKYAYLNTTLPTSTYKPGTIHAGDLMLWGNNCLVLFYETFSSSYNYTRVGSLDDPTGIAQAVGSGNITVRFELLEDETLLGDVNGDGEVSITDVTTLVDHLLGSTPATFDADAANVNHDGDISIGDVTALVDIILDNERG